MKMKKLLSVAVLLILMATPLVLVSCSNDDLTEDIEESGTKLDVWIEPCHIKGANVDVVKSYMTQSMTRYHLLSETSTAGNIQLTYVTGKEKEGIVYSFSSFDGSLYSVIDTERIVNRGTIIDFPRKHYTLVNADDKNIQYCFANNDKSIVITTTKVSESYFNVNYSFVY